MSLETGCAIATLVSLVLAVPAVRRGFIRRDEHAALVMLALCVGYGLLAALFVVDLVVQQPLSATLRFTRGYAAGIAVGLLVSASALWAYDRSNRHSAGRDTSSPA